MSLKLGNTNIAGTQILYSTTGNNTDGAMTQNATTTQLNLKANDANVVHKTGNETIGGDKTFQTNILYKKSTQDFITTPAKPYYTEIRNVDINNFEIGQFRVWKDTDGANIIDLLGRYQDNSVNFYGAVLGIRSYSNGRSFPYASASDRNGSIVTTTGINKSENGYVKLGNGLIIQWGTVGTGANFSVTFPTPFTSSASYGIASGIFHNNGNDVYALNIKNRTNTGFTGYLNNGYTGACYIAIGY